MSTTTSPEALDSTGVTGTAEPAQKKAATRVGWVLTALVIAFLAFDVFGKLTRPTAVVEGTLKLGFTADQIIPIGVMLGVSLILFVIPRTTFLGALFLTAYLGGAVCANFRMHLSVPGYVLSPVYVALVLWAGLFLRSARLRALVAAGR